MPFLAAPFAAFPARRAVTAAVLLAPAALAVPLVAQLPGPGPVERPLGPGTASGEPRLQGGATFTLAQPVHEFRAAVPNTGLGGSGHFLYRVGALGAFAVRADAGFLRYGRERRRVPILPGVGRVTADLVTTNNIFTLGVGPQLMAPSGLVRPYVNANVGLAAFTTTSELRDRNGGGSDDDGVIASDRNQSSVTWASAGGGGVLMRLGQGRRSLAFLDLGARYQHNGRARYLTKGGVVDLPDGSVALDVREGPANFWTYHVGLSFGSR